MPRAANAYIALVIASGTTVLLIAAGSWSSASLREFAIFLGLAVLASTFKVKIPGLESTVSPNFVFLLLAMTACRFSEVVVITLTAALVQTLWATKQARLVQVTFSSATLVLSSCVAFQGSHALLGTDAQESPVAFVILAGSLYMPLNAALVSAVIGLVEGRSVVEVTRACYQHVFPYFMAGIVFAGMISGTFARPVLWKGAIVLLPIVVLGYIYSAIRNAVGLQPAINPVQTRNEELIEST